MGTIKIHELSFKYDGMLTNLFEQLNLNIDDSWRLGLIGRNGRGKTTFLKILMDQLAYHGQISTNVKFTYFPQTITKPEHLTQTVLLDIAGLDDSQLWQIQIEMDKLGLGDEVLGRPFQTLSPGEQTKALLAVMFSQPGTFKLIDEPTNHLDANARVVVADYLKSKSGFIVVSHDRYFIDQIIDHVLSIDRAKIQLFTGNYETWQREFDRKNAAEQAEKHQLKNEIRRLNTATNRIKQWAGNAEVEKSQNHYRGQGHVMMDKGFLGHKAAKVMKRSKNALNRTESAITKKKSLLKNLDEMPALTLNYQKPYQQYLLRVMDLQVSRNGMVLNQPLSFDLKPGQRQVLLGSNGFGKTTVVKALLGEKALIVNGTISWAATLKISYLTQNFETLRGPIDSYAKRYGIALSDLLNMLRKLGFERTVFAEDLSQLSMGQKRKVSLARSLCEPANLYIWDEPLNYLDVITRRQIEKLILDKQPPMLVIDHDRDFIKAIANVPMIEMKRPHH